MAERDFDSLWMSEVLTGQGPDPLIALATAAALNPRLKLGTTMLLPGRHELRLAKALASLDVMSGGRLLLTFVPGLVRGPERDAIGVDVPDRSAAIERTMPKLRRWWAGEAVDGVTLAPLPIQDPLEMWLGGLAPASLERCGRLADGWLGATCTPDEARQAIVAINRAASAADRVIDPEHFGMSIGYADETLEPAQSAALAARVGRRNVDPAAMVPVGADGVRRAIEAFIEVGVSKFVVRRIAPPVSWVAALDDLAGAVASLQT
jgi:probable F420-dependent oxidoreductase